MPYISFYGASYTEITIVDLNSVTNGASGATSGLTAGVEVTGFSASDIVRVSLPTGQTYAAWSPWGDPSPAVVDSSGTKNLFSVIPDGVAADMFFVGDSTVYDGYEAARAAFGARTFTGATSYIFYIDDILPGDNTGGLSILIEKAAPA